MDNDTAMSSGTAPQKTLLNQTEPHHAHTSRTRAKKWIFIFLSLGALGIIFVFGVYTGIKRGIPFLRDQGELWSVGIYTGKSPLELAPAPGIQQPVLQASDVTDREALFLADPFLMPYQKTASAPKQWFMFFEVMRADEMQADIGLAKSSDGLNWQYDRIVLDEPWHMSYPYVFEWEGEHYLLPESSQTYTLRLYKARNFPYDWEYVGTLLYGNYSDPTLFRFQDTWWIMTTDRNDVLRLFYADDLMDRYQEHPKSPVVFGNRNIARPAGRLVEYEGKLIRFAQDDEPTYGNSVHALEITKLTKEEYEERELPESPVVSASGEGWNANGMHQFDVHPLNEKKWIAVVDGYRRKFMFDKNF